MIKNKGFTLIELLVVVSIISMLTTVVLSALGDARNKGNDTARVQTTKQVSNALNMYFNDNGYYPTSLTTLTSASAKNSNKPYIASVDTTIFTYSAVKDKATFGACDNLPTGSYCLYFHLGTVLLNNTATVLKNDANITESTNDLVNGKSDNCTGSNVLSGTAKCYDITP
jgi:prepilin-type N-terminal cleavage/methylation domain-containing protein